MTLSYRTYASQKGSLGSSKTTKLVVEDFCIDIFFYFDKSIKRYNALHSYAKNLDISKHVNKNWLCLERATEITVLHHASLKSFFQTKDASKLITNVSSTRCSI